MLACVVAVAAACTDNPPIGGSGVDANLRDGNGALDASGEVGGGGDVAASTDAPSAEAATIDTAPRCVDMDGDGFPVTECGGMAPDCDDGNDRVNPGRSEVCDRNDLDEDCNPCTVAGATDGDGDTDTFLSATCANTFRGATPTCSSAVRVRGGRVTGTDCEDGDGNVRPNQTEACNNRDDNCNEMIDEDVTTASWYLDRDGDGHAGVMEAAVTACAAPSPRHVRVNDDCDDTDPLVSPGAPEVCDGAMRDENCNGMQNEACGCSPVGVSRMCCGERGTQTCTSSPAGSTWSACSATTMLEVCDGVDNNCDGTADEGLRVQCYRDVDGDGFAVAGTLAESLCPPGSVAGVCPAGYARRAPEGTAMTDCDDSAATGRTRFPGNPEVCNGADDNCNETADDGDPGGGGTCASGQSGICSPGVNHCRMGMITCVANVMGRPEICNGLDDNCNGGADEGNPGGGVGCSVPGAFGPCSAGITQCSGGAIRCTQTVFPQAPNCNTGGDLNCNNRLDNAEWTSCMSAPDPLHPGFNGCAGRQCAGAGACAVTVSNTPYRHDGDHDGACVPTNDAFCTGYPLGAEWRVASTCRGGGDDCDDGNAARYPGNPEIADGIDNNCAGGCEEGLVTKVYSLRNPGDRADNMLSAYNNEAGWGARAAFFTYNAPVPGRTVGTQMVRCVSTSGRHFITQGANNCASPNVIEGYYGYLFSSPHTGSYQVQDCYGTCGGRWCEMASRDSCGSWAGSDGLPWVSWAGGFGYTVGSSDSACWAP
jgi:hypothetical protein